MRGQSPRSESKFQIQALPVLKSLRPADFVLRVELQRFAVSRFPVAQVGFSEYVRSLQRPAQLRLIREAYSHIQHSFLENVFGPIHDLAVDAGILLPGLGRNLAGFSAVFFFFIGSPPLLPGDLLRGERLATGRTAECRCR